MEVTYEGEAHHPDLVLPVVVDQPPPPAEPLSRSLPLPPRLARSHKIEEDEEMNDYELLLDLLNLILGLVKLSGDGFIVLRVSNPGLLGVLKIIPRLSSVFQNTLYSSQCGPNSNKF